MEKAFVMRTINFAHDLDCLAARRVYPSKRTVGKEIRQCTSHGREELPKILVGQYWPGRSPKALSDQLAKQAVLLADARHLDVPAESKRVPGVGHELHPQAFRPHPEMTGHRRNTLRCAEHFLRASARANNKLRRYGDGRTTVWDTIIIMIVHVLKGKTEIVCVLRLPFCMALFLVRALRTHAPRA